jgi:hypothetical protein
MSSRLDLPQLDEIPDPYASASAAPMPPAARRPHARSPSRARVRALRWASVAAAIVYDAVAIAFLHVRPNLGSTPAWALAIELSIPLAAASVALAAVARKGPNGLGETTVRVALLSVTAPVVFALATVALAPHDTLGAAFWPAAARCIGVTAILAAGPATFGLLAVRRAFAAAPAWRMAALGIVCGAFAAAAISFVCPVNSAYHVLVGHGAMMLLLGGLGGLIGHRVAAP